jgi:hypothetical protein
MIVIADDCRVGLAAPAAVALPGWRGAGRSCNMLRKKPAAEALRFGGGLFGYLIPLRLFWIPLVCSF